MPSTAPTTTMRAAGDDLPTERRIRLSREPDFFLGPLRFAPSRRAVACADGREEVVEPRVMQVLVALFQAKGAIVGRDELIERCWDGRIVGEDAINRVISRLRRLQQSTGRDAFEVETVTRVGYRLRLLPQADIDASPTEDQGETRTRPPPDRSPWRTDRWPRRDLIRTAAALATAAGAPALWALGDRTAWFGLMGHRPNARARRFYDQGMQVQYNSLVATSELAEGWFRQAAEADPDWPDAWSSLAMSYRHMLDGETNVAQWRLVERTRSAARRALQLDPDNAEALVALALIRSPFPRWAEAETEYRALVRRFPEAFVARGHLGRLLCDVGRYAAGLDMFTIQVSQQPFVLAPATFQAQALWGLGRFHEAEAAYKSIIERWPSHVWAWTAYTMFLTYAGRPGAAAVFASDREARPSGVPDFVLDRRMFEARALATRNPTDIARAREALLSFETRSLGMSPSTLPVPFILPFYVAIGDLDTAFAMLDGFYFERGRYAPNGRIGALTRRESNILFMPWALPLRRDERFPPLLRELGLVDYWRQTGTRPDVPMPALG